jgi:hypothetical protein
MAAAQDERLVPSSQAKLDELFLQWLSLPEAQQYVLTLLASARQVPKSVSPFLTR